MVQWEWARREVVASEQFDTVALVGAGVIGRGWIRVLAPRCQVRLYNPDAAGGGHALAGAGLGDDGDQGQISASDAALVLERALHTNPLRASA
jgi:3-hydroxyacyl-CoA dehydrogenase